MTGKIVFLFPSSASTEATAPLRILMATPLLQAGYEFCLVGSTVIANWHPSFFPTLPLEAPYVDFVVRGQGGGALLELVQPIESRSASDLVAGIVWGFGKRDSQRVSAMRLEVIGHDRRIGVRDG